MAREVHQFSATIPAGTPRAAPITFPFNMPPREVVEIEIEVPPGPRGEVGFAIAQAGSPIFPYEPATYIVTDNQTLSWPLEDANTSGAWQLIAYNTGAYPHTLYVRFFTNLTDAGSTDTMLDPVPNDVLSS